jgi:hypothetical protein
MNLIYQTTAGVQIPQYSLESRLAPINTSYNPISQATNALDNLLQRLIDSYNNLTLNLVGRIYQAFPTDSSVRNIHDSMYFSSKKNRKQREEAEREGEQDA